MTKDTRAPVIFVDDKTNKDIGNKQKKIIVRIQ